VDSTSASLKGGQHIEKKAEGIEGGGEKALFKNGQGRGGNVPFSVWAWGGEKKSTGNTIIEKKKQGKGGKKE